MNLPLTLFPPPDIPAFPNGFCLQKGTQTFPFRFRIPILLACESTKDYITHLNTTLPQSFKVIAPKNVAMSEMKYFLRVKVERPGRFKADITEQQELKFMPLDPSLPPPMLVPMQSRNSRNVLPEPVGAGTSPLSPTQQFKQRKVTLEVTLPSPAILHTKHSLPLQVSVFATKTSVHSSSPVILCSCCVTLVTKLTVTVGLNSTLYNHTDLAINVQDLD